MTHSKFGLTPVLLTTTTYYNFLFVKNCSYTLTNLISLLLSAKKHMSFIQNKLVVFYFPTNNTNLFLHIFLFHLLIFLGFSFVVSVFSLFFNFWTKFWILVSQFTCIIEVFPFSGLSL